MEIAPFRIEEYYAVHELTAPHMLSSSDAKSRASFSALLRCGPPRLSRSQPRARALEPHASRRVPLPTRRSRPVADTGVLLLPGTVYDEPKHVRVGFGRASLPEVLAQFEASLETHS